MRYTEISTLTGRRQFQCAICGEYYGQGGKWHGIGQVITVCPSDECIRSLLHLAIDALKDGPYPSEEERIELLEYWNYMTKEAIDCHE